MTIFFVLALISLFLADYVVQQRAKKNLYTDVSAIPHQKVGLVLGTVKHLANGQVNLYYHYRVEACYELFAAGKIDFVLVSGDNSRKGYNEPATFKADLVDKGIPAERIYLDFAGFRTLDSVVRAQKVFGQDQFTLISQRFHNERALFIARAKGLSAVGYNAQEPSLRYGFKVRLREVFARVKMFLDLYVLRTKPKFLGEPVQMCE